MVMRWLFLCLAIVHLAFFSLHTKVWGDRCLDVEVRTISTGYYVKQTRGLIISINFTQNHVKYIYPILPHFQTSHKITVKMRQRLLEISRVSRI